MYRQLSSSSSSSSASSVEENIESEIEDFEIIQEAEIANLLIQNDSGPIMSNSAEVWDRKADLKNDNDSIATGMNNDDRLNNELVHVDVHVVDKAPTDDSPRSDSYDDENVIKDDVHKDTESDKDSSITPDELERFETQKVFEADPHIVNELENGGELISTGSAKNSQLTESTIEKHEKTVAIKENSSGASSNNLVATGKEPPATLADSLTESDHDKGDDVDINDVSKSHGKAVFDDPNSLKRDISNDSSDVENLGRKTVKVNQDDAPKPDDDLKFKLLNDVVDQIKGANDKDLGKKQEVGNVEQDKPISGQPFAVIRNSNLADETNEFSSSPLHQGSKADLGRGDFKDASLNNDLPIKLIEDSFKNPLKDEDEVETRYESEEEAPEDTQNPSTDTVSDGDEKAKQIDKQAPSFMNDLKSGSQKTLHVDENDEPQENLNSLGDLKGVFKPTYTNDSDNLANRDSIEALHPDPKDELEQTDLRANLRYWEEKLRQAALEKRGSVEEEDYSRSTIKDTVVRGDSPVAEPAHQSGEDTDSANSMQEVIASSSTSSAKTSSSQKSDIEDVTKKVKAEHLTSTSSSSTSSLSGEEEDATKEIDTEENSTNEQNGLLNQPSLSHHSSTSSMTSSGNVPDVSNQAEEEKSEVEMKSEDRITLGSEKIKDSKGVIGNLESFLNNTSSVTSLSSFFDDDDVAKKSEATIQKKIDAEGSKSTLQQETAEESETAKPELTKTTEKPTKTSKTKSTPSNDKISRTATPKPIVQQKEAPVFKVKATKTKQNDSKSNKDGVNSSKPTQEVKDKPTWSTPQPGKSAPMAAPVAQVHPENSNRNVRAEIPQLKQEKRSKTRHTKKDNHPSVGDDLPPKKTRYGEVRPRKHPARSSEAEKRNKPFHEKKKRDSSSSDDSDVKSESSNASSNDDDVKNKSSKADTNIENRTRPKSAKRVRTAPTFVKHQTDLDQVRKLKTKVGSKSPSSLEDSSLPQNHSKSKRARKFIASSPPSKKPTKSDNEKKRRDSSFSDSDDVSTDSSPSDDAPHQWSKTPKNEENLLNPLRPKSAKGARTRPNFEKYQTIEVQQFTRPKSRRSRVRSSSSSSVANLEHDQYGVQDRKEAREQQRVREVFLHRCLDAYLASQLDKHRAFFQRRFASPRSVKRVKTPRRIVISRNRTQGKRSRVYDSPPILPNFSPRVWEEEVKRNISRLIAELARHESLGTFRKQSTATQSTKLRERRKRSDESESSSSEESSFASDNNKERGRKKISVTIQTQTKEKSSSSEDSEKEMRAPLLHKSILKKDRSHRKTPKHVHVRDVDDDVIEASTKRPKRSHHKQATMFEERASNSRLATLLRALGPTDYLMADSCGQLHHVTLKHSPVQRRPTAYRKRLQTSSKSKKKEKVKAELQKDDSFLASSDGSVYKKSASSGKLPPRSLSAEQGHDSNDVKGGAMVGNSPRIRPGTEPIKCNWKPTNSESNKSQPKFSDHQLKNSNNPSVLEWLSRKNTLARRNRIYKYRENRSKRDRLMEEQNERDDRRAHALIEYEKWKKHKNRETLLRRRREALEANGNKTENLTPEEQRRNILMPNKPKESTVTAFSDLRSSAVAPHPPSNPSQKGAFNVGNRRRPKSAPTKVPFGGPVTGNTPPTPRDFVPVRIDFENGGVTIVSPRHTNDGTNLSARDPMIQVGRSKSSNFMRDLLGEKQPKSMFDIPPPGGFNPKPPSNPEKNKEKPKATKPGFEKEHYNNWVRSKGASSPYQIKYKKKKEKAPPPSHDPLMNELLPELAKRRIKKILDQKKRVDSGLRRKSGPEEEKAPVEREDTIPQKWRLKDEPVVNLNLTNVGKKSKRSNTAENSPVFSYKKKTKSKSIFHERNPVVNQALNT